MVAPQRSRHREEPYTAREPLVGSSYPNARRQHRRPTRRGPEIELSSRQHYTPPQDPTIPVVARNPVAPSSGAVVPPPRSVPNHRHSTNHHINSMPVLNQKNPAPDLAFSLCSHGFCCMQCIRTQEIGVIEVCGAFDELVAPGLYCGFWPCATVAGRLSLRVQQLDITCETKTKDNVFVYIRVSVQFRVLVERAYDAYYSLADPQRQIQTYVFDVIRDAIPRMSLDEVFESKSSISDIVFTRLQQVMKDFGYEIVETLVANVTPNELVKYSMNEINASRRLKEATPHRGEADKLQKVKAAEGRAETLHLQGIGTANQRRAIVQGLKESAIQWSAENPQHNFRDAMDMILVMQYMDTLSAVGANQLIVRPDPRDVVSMQQRLPKWQESPPDLLC